MPLRNKRSGNVVIEFALTFTLMVPLLLGTVGAGLTMSRSIQVTQVARDTGRLYYQGVDLSTSANQKIVGRLAYGMGLASDANGTINTSGRGVVIVSKLLKIGTAECANGGFSGGLIGACTNNGLLVVVRRIVIGNASLRTSAFGSPGSGIILSDGTINASDYCTSNTVLVPGGATAQSLGLTAGQYTFATEAFFTTPELSGFFANQAYATNLF